MHIVKPLAAALLTLAVLALAAPPVLSASDSVVVVPVGHVNGYTKKDGTYVQPHERGAPDGNPHNNWSFPGNTNPYTGKTATGNPDTYLRKHGGGSPGTNPPSTNRYNNRYGQ